MGIRGIIGLVLFIVIGIKAVQVYQLENQNINLTSTVNVLGKRLSDSTNALRDSRAQNQTLTAQNTGLISTTAELSSELAQVKADNAEARTQVYKGQLQQRETDKQLTASLAKLSQSERLRLANQDVAGVGAVGVTDEEKTGQIADLKSKLINRDSVVIPGLRTEVAQQTARADSEKKRANDAQDRESELEIELNKSYNRAADRVEKANNQKRLFNIGKSKLIKEAINDVRAGRVNP